MEDAIGRPVCIELDARLCSRRTWKATVRYSGPIHSLSRRNLKTHQSPGIVDSWSTENSGMEITWSSPCLRFPNAPVYNFFSSTLKRKAGVFKFLRFEERFRKAPFSWRISVDGRPSLHTSLVAHQAGAYPGFSSVKRLGVILLPPEWDASPSQGYPQH